MSKVKAGKNLLDFASIDQINLLLHQADGFELFFWALAQTAVTLQWHKPTFGDTHYKVSSELPKEL